MIEQIISIIAPHQCLACHTEGRLICKNCVAQLPVPDQKCYKCGNACTSKRTCQKCRSPLKVISAATKYEGTAKDLIYHLKFGRATAAANDVAQIISERVAFPADAIFVPVPTVPKRVRIRGYDQSVLIARNLAVLRGQAYIPLLARLGQQRQVGQSRQKREQQMRGAFRLVQHPVPPTTPIILVDDVLTTGASLKAAARQLRAAGFSRVSAVVFAVA